MNLTLPILGIQFIIRWEVQYYQCKDVEWQDDSTLTIRLTQDLNDEEKHNLSRRLLTGR